LRRAIRSRVEDPLAEKLLAGTYQKGDTIRLSVCDDQLVFT
jgi:ATP-dependent Clp protease ATP-binding subunit ClpB